MISRLNNGGKCDLLFKIQLKFEVFKWLRFMFAKLQTLGVEVQFSLL